MVYLGTKDVVVKSQLTSKVTESDLSESSLSNIHSLKPTGISVNVFISRWLLV